MFVYWHVYWKILHLTAFIDACDSILYFSTNCLRDRLALNASLGGSASRNDSGQFRIRMYALTMNATFDGGVCKNLKAQLCTERHANHSMNISIRNSSGNKGSHPHMPHGKECHRNWIDAESGYEEATCHVLRTEQVRKVRKFNLKKSFLMSSHTAHLSKCSISIVNTCVVDIQFNIIFFRSRIAHCRLSSQTSSITISDVYLNRYLYWIS